ncbi:MAG: excalibur calcium-binding domain-containing protein [Marmoricola sp.]
MSPDRPGFQQPGVRTTNKNRLDRDGDGTACER